MLPAEVANRTHEQFWDYSLPVNPVDIATRAGFTVFTDPSLEISGYYDETRRRILINPLDPPNRQRFSIAHELGHALMQHGSSPRDGRRLFTQDNYILKEFEANEFAGELLMQREAVKVMIEQRNLDFDALCEKFGVSAEAMSIRLKRLGYVR